MTQVTLQSADKSAASSKKTLPNPLLNVRSMGLSISLFELSDPETTKESGNTISGQSSPSGQQF